MFFFSCSGTTFETAVGEYSPQNVSTGTLHLVLIVIVLLAIFILEIAVAFGVLFSRRHQGRMNQGKFLALFALFIYVYLDIASPWKPFIGLLSLSDIH